MELFFLLLVILLAAKIGADLCLRVGQPSVLGEILAGVAIGILVHYGPFDVQWFAELTEGHLFEGLVELGGFCLLLAAGIELDARDMLEASKRSTFIAIAGMMVPFAAGTLLGVIYFPRSDMWTAQIVFVGTALAITAVPVAIKVLMDVGQLDSAPGKAIVAAAVADDVFSLLLLAVLTGLMASGVTPGIDTLALVMAKAGAFALITVLLFRLQTERVEQWLEQLKFEDAGFVALLLAGLLLAVLAELLGLHFILGAFAAGLLFSRRSVSRERYERTKSTVDALAHGFLGPVFFVSIGLHLDLSAVTSIPGFLTLLIVAAFVGKIVGAGGAARLTGFDTHDSWAIGVSMSARGVVELIVASIAAKAGLFLSPDPPPPVIEHLYSAVVIMAIVTSVAVPVTLRLLMRQR